MLLLELPSSEPAGYLAWEDALLDTVEDGGDEVLWFWESQNILSWWATVRVLREVDVDACRSLGFPVLRRSSGGGAVLQGPGCLNYGVALRAHHDGPLGTIPGANREILSRVASAIAPMMTGKSASKGILT